LALLLLGGDFLLRAAVAAAARWQVPKVVVGMTIFTLALGFCAKKIRAQLARRNYFKCGIYCLLGCNACIKKAPDSRDSRATDAFIAKIKD